MYYSTKGRGPDPATTSGYATAVNIPTNEHRNITELIDF